MRELAEGLGEVTNDIGLVTSSSKPASRHICRTRTRPFRGMSKSTKASRGLKRAARPRHFDSSSRSGVKSMCPGSASSVRIAWRRLARA